MLQISFENRVRLLIILFLILKIFHILDIITPLINKIGSIYGLLPIVISLTIVTIFKIQDKIVKTLVT